MQSLDAPASEMPSRPPPASIPAASQRVGLRWRRAPVEVLGNQDPAFDLRSAFCSGSSDLVYETSSGSSLAVQAFETDFDAFALAPAGTRVVLEILPGAS